MPGDFDWGDIGTPGPDDFSDPMGDAGGFDFGGIGTPGPDTDFIGGGGGFSDVFNPWGEQDLGEFATDQMGGMSGGSGGGAGGLLNGLKKLFGGKGKGTDAMALLALLMGARGNGNSLADSDEMKALLQSQKKRMDLQDPLFNAATRTAFGLLPTASREGLSINGWGAPAQPQAPAAPEAPRSANLDNLGNPLRQGSRHVNPGGNLGRLKR